MPSRDVTPKVRLPWGLPGERIGGCAACAGRGVSPRDSLGLFPGTLRGRREIEAKDQNFIGDIGRRTHEALPPPKTFFFVTLSVSPKSMFPERVSRPVWANSMNIIIRNYENQPYEYNGSDDDFLPWTRGKVIRVDAPLPTVDESFRTCCHCRTCSLYPTRGDDVII